MLKILNRFKKLILSKHSKWIAAHSSKELAQFEYTIARLNSAKKIDLFRTDYLE